MGKNAKAKELKQRIQVFHKEGEGNERRNERSRARLQLTKV